MRRLPATCAGVRARLWRRARLHKKDARPVRGWTETRGWSTSVSRTGMSSRNCIVDVPGQIRGGGQARESHRPCAHGRHAVRARKKGSQASSKSGCNKGNNLPSIAARELPACPTPYARLAEW